jgi:hypothetical protein
MVVTPAEELFDFESEPELIDRFESVVTDGRPIENASIGLRLADGTLPCRVGAWRAQHNEDESPYVVVAATDVSKYRGAGRIHQYADLE